MGRFLYDSIKVDLDDRVLAHLQLVIGSKLRRGESFHFVFYDDPSISSGRTVVWLHPRSSISYKFSGTRQPEINFSWIENLVATANSAGGLRIVPEPTDQARSTARPHAANATR